MQMVVSLSNMIQIAGQNRIYSSVPLTKGQFDLLNALNQFAVHQAMNDSEVRRMPAKMLYKVNAELKLAIVALLTTCALLNPKRSASDMASVFQRQVHVIQKETHTKQIDFGAIHKDLVQQFLIPEIVNDWILYRDTCGDGIHALMDYKTALQGLTSFRRGGDPVYEFARFYRKFMEDKIAKQQKVNWNYQKIALQTLSEKLIDQQLKSGVSPEQIFGQITQGTFFQKQEKTDSPSLNEIKKITGPS